MNNSVNVQPVSFGMAYKVSNVEKFREAVNKLSCEERFTLAEDMKKATEALKNTKYADVYTDVDKDEIYHLCQFRSPYLNPNGKIESRIYICNKQPLPEAIQTALEKEKTCAAEKASFEVFDFLA